MEKQKLMLATEELRLKGLNLITVFDLKEFPENLRQKFYEADVSLEGFKRLVLIGNSGPLFWRTLKKEPGELLKMENPVDSFALNTVRKVIEKYWKEATMCLLYPGNKTIPLQQLGKLAGWHYDSPLGIGIMKSIGTWYAYRVLFLTEAPIPPTLQKRETSPCEKCLELRCIKSCPAKALSEKNPIDIRKCVTFRLKPDSPCKYRCIARESCPVGLNNIYDKDQIQYHYKHSLLTLKKHFHKETNTSLHTIEDTIHPY